MYRIILKVSNPEQIRIREAEVYIEIGWRLPSHNRLEMNMISTPLQTTCVYVSSLPPPWLTAMNIDKDGNMVLLLALNSPLLVDGIPVCSVGQSLWIRYLSSLDPQYKNYIKEELIFRYHPLSIFHILVITYVVCPWSGELLS